MQTLPTLNPGDSVEIVAPASRFSDKILADLKQLLESWQLKCLIADNIFGEDLLCANSDENRFQSLKKALQNPDTKAVICGRGGYGSMRLIPELAKLAAPKSPKLFIGMSDITALHLFIEKNWRWPTLHGALNIERFSPESIAQLKSLIFREIQQVEFSALPLNSIAKKSHVIEAPITGGNLCIVQSSIGTIWQLEGQNKIIFLEDVSERGYRIDRMLEHLHQATILKGAVAIVLGDFIDGKEPDGSSLVDLVLQRFAQNIKIPVVKIEGVGHGHTNFPLPLGTNAKLCLGDEVKLSIRI